MTAATSLRPTSPLLTLTPTRPGTVATVAEGASGQIARGEIVSHEERLYFVLGFDGTDVPGQRAYLEDVETHDVRTAALTELAACSRAAVA